MRVQVKGSVTATSMPGVGQRGFVAGEELDIDDNDAELVAWARGFQKAGYFTVVTAPARKGATPHG